MDKLTIGKYIKEKRISQGLTMQQLATKAGINRYQTVMRIENGTENYKLDTFLSILTALNVKVEFIEDETVFNFKNVNSAK